MAARSPRRTSSPPGRPHRELRELLLRPRRALPASVKDPYDETSPFHRWTEAFTQSDMAARLSGLYRGRFRRVEVLERGDSPRIVAVRIHGTDGDSVISGTTLKLRLDLRDAWAKFERVDAAGAKAAKSEMAGADDAVEAAGDGAPPEPVSGEPEF